MIYKPIQMKSLMEKIVAHWSLGREWEAKHKQSKRVMHGETAGT
jgi:hypothetical protein